MLDVLFPALVRLDDAVFDPAVVAELDPAVCLPVWSGSRRQTPAESEAMGDLGEALPRRWMAWAIAPFMLAACTRAVATAAREDRP